MAPIQFAYWVPNISKGLVTSDVPQRTNPSIEYNLKLARIAEDKGFTFALTQIRFSAGGGDYQYESVAYSHALLAGTSRLNVIAAILPGPWPPHLVAKQFATIDYLTGGRLSVNVVSGWYKDEQTRMGIEWLDHDERYVRSREFIRVIKGLWNEKQFSFQGKYYNFDKYEMEPKPGVRFSPSSTGTGHGTIAGPAAPVAPEQSTGETPPTPPHAASAVSGGHWESKRGPTVFMGGNSAAARQLGGTDADWFFFNGNDDDVFEKWILDVRENARRAGRRIRVGINGFVVARSTTAEAYAQLNYIVNGANPEKLQAAFDRFKEAGKASPEGEGMWANASLKDLVQGNEGIRTGLIGSYEQVARRIVGLKALGADLVLTAFLHFQDELSDFGDKVIPLVRQYEQEAIDSGDAATWPTYENYPVPPEKAALNRFKARGKVDHIAIAEEVAKGRRGEAKEVNGVNGKLNGNGDTNDVAAKRGAVEDRPAKRVKV